MISYRKMRKQLDASIHNTDPQRLDNVERVVAMMLDRQTDAETDKQYVAKSSGTFSSSFHSRAIETFPLLHIGSWNAAIDAAVKAVEDEPGRDNYRDNQTAVVMISNATSRIRDLKK